MRRIENLILILICIFCLTATIILFINYNKYYDNNQLKEMIDCGFGVLLFSTFSLICIISYFEEKTNDIYEDRIIELEINNEINENNIHSLINNLNELYIEVHEKKE